MRKGEPTKSNQPSLKGQCHHLAVERHVKTVFDALLRLQDSTDVMDSFFRACNPSRKWKD